MNYSKSAIFKTRITNSNPVHLKKIHKQKLKGETETFSVAFGSVAACQALTPYGKMD